ncbi:MAG: hypothetical protein M1830_001352 [Pleopsidium flavum]|nr:MAG: hypothetical protein M1830_001352 [Pleopsidium flavum]
MPQRTKPKSKPKPKPHHKPSSITAHKPTITTTTTTTTKPLIIPKNWPSNITYLSQPIYSPHLTLTELSSLVSTTPPPSSHPTSSRPTQSQPTPTPTPTPSPTIRILPITTPPTHPALHEHGLYTTRALSPGTHILDYTGYIHSSRREDTDPQSDYDLSLDRELGIGIDAGRMGNEGRFVNDYRGVRAGGPNAEFRDGWVFVREGGRGGRWERRVGVWVLGGRGRRGVGIGRGEEVVVSYGKGFWRERQVEVEEMSQASETR